MNILQKYTDIKNPGSFSGISGFLKNNPKFNLNQVKKELIKTETYTKHKPLIKSFPRATTYVPFMDHTWQIDLVDVTNLKNKKYGQYFTFLFVCIDVFSKYAFVIPMKNKSADESTRAFQEILNKSGRKPINLYSDNGKEFLGSFQKLLFKNKIHQIFTKSIHKASIVERFNRTLKERLYRVFSFQKSNNYIDILQDLITSYNNSFHSSIKMKPNQVTTKNTTKVHNNLYNNKKLFNATITFLFKIGDYVRIPIKKKIFEKGYTANWSEEIYIVNTLLLTDPPRYELITLNDVLIEDKFYKEELQKVTFKEFPYDSFSVLKSNKNQILLKKLNSEKQKEVWVDKEEYTENSINTKRITRSTAKNINI